MTTMHGTLMSVDAATLGSELTAAAIVGATTLHVADSADFFTTSGWLSLNGVAYAITAIDDTNDILTIASPGLTVAGAAGDPVNVWDQTINQPACELRATVVSMMSDNTGDPISAIIDPGVYQFLPLGPRNAWNGEPEGCTLEDRNGIWWVVSLDGTAQGQILATSPNGPNRIEIAASASGEDTINFYQNDVLVGSIQGYNDGTENVLQLVGDPVNANQAILQLGTDYGIFFNKSGAELFKFDANGAYVQGGIVTINTATHGEITIDTNGLKMFNGNGFVLVKPTGEIDLNSTNGSITMAGGILIESGTHALTLDGQQVIIGTASVTQVSSPGASTTPATSTPAPGGAWSPMAIHLSNGVIGYDSSSIDTKHDVQGLDTTHRASLIDELDLVTFRGNGLEADDPWRDVGLVAEQVDQLGWPELVVHDADGKVAGVRYDRLVVGLIAELRELKAKVVELEGRAA